MGMKDKVSDFDIRSSIKEELGDREVTLECGTTQRSLRDEGDLRP